MFISAGVETVSRGRRLRPPDAGHPRTRCSRTRSARTGEEPQAAAHVGGPARAASCRTSTSRWARPRRTWPQLRGVSRAEQDEFAVRSARTAPSRPSPMVSGSARSRRSPCRTERPGSRRGPACRRRRSTAGGLKPVFRPDGTVTAGNACPLNDGAAALVIMSRCQGGGARHHAACSHRRNGRVGPLARGHGSRPGRGQHEALSNAGLSIADIDLVEINEAFAAQVIPSARSWESRSTRSTSTVAQSPWGTRSG